MFKQLQRFRQLGPFARAQYLHAAILLPMLKINLKWRGLQKTLRALERRLPGNHRGKQEATGTDEVRTTVRMVRAAARHSLIRPSCLEESLALWWLLARQGFAPQLRIGVRKPGDGFEAHAWVELDGAPLNEAQPQGEQFAVFDADLSATPRKDP